MEQIETIWEITKDWESHWAEWKSGKFADMQTKDMEETSNMMYKKLGKMSRDLKVRIKKYGGIMMYFWIEYPCDST